LKFVVACWGSRGDVEPNLAVGRELARRGHDVCMAVPPDLIPFTEAAGVAAVAYGVDWSATMELLRPFWPSFWRNPWRIDDLIRFGRETWVLFARCWEEMSKALMSVADGADLLFSGQSFEEQAINVAEYYDIPFATLHYNPIRAKALQVRAYEWLYWLVSKKIENAQRRELGLPKATSPAPRRITERGSLELQAYDDVSFPGVAAGWEKWKAQRPNVGNLTMDLPTDADEEVASWIAAGTPPIYFGFGSVPIDSAADMLAMISAACAQLGERALFCSGGTDLSHAPHFDNVKVVGAVNHGAIFPACRAVVHHGSTGSTAASLRAGVPTLILWKLPDQRDVWGAAVQRLKVGTARRRSTTTLESLVEDLRTILAPDYATRAREVAARTTKPAESVAAAADLLENFARSRRVGLIGEGGPSG
jgi:UDP:flavonoid glycosyltransferase YjiC (YdhE family)